MDARQRRDLRGRDRRRLPDGAGGLRAGLVGRPVPHQRRRRDLEDARHRHDGAPVRSSPRRRRRPSSSPARPACAARPTAATRSRPSRARTSSKARLDAIDRAGSALFASGSRDLLRSTDRGKTWKAMHKPTVNHKPARLVQVDFLDAKNGYFLAQGGALWRTANAGQVVDLAARRGHRQGLRHRLLVEDQGLPGHRSLRRRDATARASCSRRPTAAARGTRSSWSRRRSWAPASPRPRAPTDYLLGGQSSFLFTTTSGEAGKASTLSVTTKRKKLSKPAGITVTGKLSPAAGNERVTVSYLPPGSGRWQHQTVKTAANGSYTTSWRVRQGQQPLRGPVGGRLPLQGRRLGRADREGRQVGESATRPGRARRRRARPWPHAAPSASRAWGRWSASGGSPADSRGPARGGSARGSPRR